MADPLRAEITNATDPQGLGRVKIRCPVLSGDREIWVQVLRPDPTSPQPAYKQEDIVLIFLEGGDPNLPVVIGTLSSRS